VVGAVFLVLSGGLLITVRLVFDKATESIQTQDLFGDAGADIPRGKVPAGPLNILLVGLDARPDKPEAASRADTIVILHIPAARDRTHLISVPRDLMVEAKPFAKSGYGGGRAKMTETFFFGAQRGAGVGGGMELLAGTIKDRLGVTLNFAAIINFDSFTRVVEKLGGVDLCVDQTVTSKHIYVDAAGKPHDIEGEPNPSRFGRPASYRKGECRRFAPWEALDYSRQRYGLKNGDYDRQRHQLQLIKAIVKEATSQGVLTNPGKLTGVIEAAGAAFIVDTRGIPIPDFILALGGLAGSEMVSLRTNGGKIHSTQVNGVSYETLTPESEQMFEAVRSDAIEGFLATHPDYVATA
jgi:LCP family protein required for cell wall assembly